MVIETNVTGIYVHAAYATDDKGTDFSLTSFPEAVYIGNYMDRSATESTDPNMYKWKPLYSDNVSPADIEDDSEAYESVDVADVQANVDSLEGAATDLKVRTGYNEDNLEKTQSTQDEGLGNLNLLVGTNQGDSNWTAGSATIASVTDPVYSDDPNDDIETVQFTLTSATDTFTFDSGNLLDYIAANDEEENTYTLSYDIKVSNTSATMVPSVPSILTFESPEFIDDPDDDFSDTWLHFASTAVISSTSGTDFQFTYSGASADTVQIANLKIEAGALATPWRASLDEVEGIANTALSTANTANTNATSALNAAQAVANHFWYDTDGAHVTEVTETEWKDISDPNYHSGGNTLITSTGMSIRNGLTDLATFGSSGVQIGRSGSGHTIVNAAGLQVYADLVNSIANIGYGQGYDAGGSLTDAPYFDFGERFGNKGNNSLIQGSANEASGYNSSAQGTHTTASANDAHAEGYYSTASNTATHAEGWQTTASGSEGSHAEGKSTTASGSSSHAEGRGTTASAAGAHAEGNSTTASEINAHAEGQETTASASNAHAQNYGTTAAEWAQTAIGTFNVVDTQPATAVHPSGSKYYGNYALIVGNGTANNARSNALTVNWVGDVTAAGDVSASSAALTGTMTVGRDPTSNMEVATKQYVDNSGGGGGWTPTWETIRNGISITTTSTNYGTNSISLSDYKFIELRLYNSSSMSSNLYPIETVKAQVNNVYINHGQVCRLGSSNVYLTWKYNDDTHLQMNINSGSNIYVGIFGIK